jgi:hypothetical protein
MGWIMAMMWLLTAITLIFVILLLYVRKCIAGPIGRDDYAYALSGVSVL